MSSPQLMSAIGKTLCKQREELGLSLNELAKCVSTEVEVLEQLEEGKLEDLDMLTLYDICEAIDLPVGQVFAAAELYAVPAVLSNNQSYSEITLR